MTKDAIVGARYRDTVFDDEFVITDATPAEFDSHDPEDIELTLEYEHQLNTVTITLAQFREEQGHEMVEVE